MEGYRVIPGCQAHQRWMLDIGDYDLKLVHVPGKELAGPDTLS